MYGWMDLGAKIEMEMEIMSTDGMVDGNSGIEERTDQSIVGGRNRRTGRAGWARMCYGRMYV